MEYDEAVEKLEAAVKLHPDRAELWCSLGVALVQLKRFEAALEKFQKAGELQPEYASAWHGMGFALTALGRKDEAAEVFKKANNNMAKAARILQIPRSTLQYKIERYKISK